MKFYERYKIFYGNIFYNKNKKNNFKKFSEVSVTKR